MLSRSVFFIVTSDIQDGKDLDAALQIVLYSILQSLLTIIPNQDMLIFSILNFRKLY